MICFYHSADLDGKCSAAIVKRWDPSCELYPINYGDPFPWYRFQPGLPDFEPPIPAVVMVDYSLEPFSQMVHLSQLTSLDWIDHHKTAIEEHAAARDAFLGKAVLNVTRAACELTWEFCHPDQPVPYGVHLLSLYDTWQWHKEGLALPYQYGLRCHDMHPESMLWDDIFKDAAGLRASAVAKHGDTILAYERLQNEAFAKAYAFETGFGGLRCICANRGMCNSQLLDRVWDPDRHDAMLLFAWKKDHWQISLYTSKPDVDVSLVCKHFGGGGHKGAAGFTASELPFTPPYTAGWPQGADI